MATPTADTYAAASGASVYAGRPASAPQPQPQPEPPLPTGKYRTHQQHLFADVLADTVVADETIDGLSLRTTPARVGIAAPAKGFVWSEHGPHRNYVDLRGGWPWVNTWGDWINASGTAQGTSDPHFTFSANAASTGSAAYTVNITTGAQAAQTGNRWHAYIVRVTGGARALVSQHHDTLPAPSVAVSYTDGTSGTLQCVACVAMPNSTAYSQTGRPEHPINPTVALEFERPAKAVASATMSVTVTQHTSTAATINGYLANPPVTVGTVVPGLAAGYSGDVGLGTHASVLVSHRYQDGSVIGDWLARPTQGTNIWQRANWDPEVLGLGAADTSKMPTAYEGEQLAGKWFHKQYFGQNLSLVPSTHIGDNFEPLAPGLGALRIITPKSTAADGAIVTAATGSDLCMLFPRDISGTDALKRTFVRFYFRFTASAKRLSATKMFRAAADKAAEHAWHHGKWGVGVHHWTSRGGNNRGGGDGLGWSNRLLYEQLPTDMPVSGLIHGIHSLDMFNGATDAPAGNVNGNLPFGKNGGRGTSIYPDHWYCLEVECDLNTWDAGGNSPYDGVQRAWLDGVLVAEWTGVRYRNGPLDPAGAGTDLPPFRQLGPFGLTLNEYMGGILPADEDRICFYAAVACGTSYIGPMNLGPATSSLPTWRPAAGDMIEYTTGDGVMEGSIYQAAVPWMDPYFARTVLTAYSGGTLNPHMGPFGAHVYFGAGHAGSNDNSVFGLEFSAAKISVKRYGDPSPIFGASTAGTNPYNNAVTTFGIGANMDAQCRYTIDGKPASAHTYDYLVIEPPGPGAPYGSLFVPMLMGASYNGPATTASFSSFRMPFTSTTIPAGGHAWEYLGTHPSDAGGSNSIYSSLIGPVSWAIYDPNHSRVMIESAQNVGPRWLTRPGAFNCVQGTGRARIRTNRVADSGRYLFIPGRNLGLFLDGSAGGALRIQWQDLSQAQPEWAVAPATLSSAPVVAGAGWGCATWCADNQRIIVGHIAGDNGAVYEVEIPAALTDTWTVTRAPLPGGKTITWRLDSTYGSWEYNPLTKCIVWYATVNSFGGADKVQVYTPRNT